MSSSRSARARSRPAPLTGAGALPLYCVAERIVLIRGVHWNLTLRELHDSIYGEPRGVEHVRFYIAKGALILSRSTLLPALRTGPWPAMALTLILENNGRILGASGAGGAGGSSPGGNPNPGSAGAMGGDAFLVERATTIINAAGQLWGGGGGGGGGGGMRHAHPTLGPGVQVHTGGGGGGGGAGRDLGPGGVGGSSVDPFPGGGGASGTETSGGAGGAGGTGVGGTAGAGGAGGAAGAAGAAGGVGSAGSSYEAAAGGAGGAPGRYVVGNALVTWTSVGDVRGSVA